MVASLNLRERRLGPSACAERALRIVAVGRKNSMLAGHETGAERAAVIHSLVGTCRRIAIDPFAYLRDVIERIPTQPKGKLWELAPRGWKDARVTQG